MVNSPCPWTTWLTSTTLGISTININLITNNIRSSRKTFQPALFKYHHQDHTGSWLDSGAPSAFYHPDDIDFDIDFLKSSSSSPSSTHSVLSHPSSLETSPLSAFDTFPTPILSEASLFPVSTEQSDQPTASCPEPMFWNSDMMQAETWRSNGQLTPRSGCAAAAPFNTHHQRDSSRSSMGSNGPLSPFAQNITNPHIAVSDATGESFHAFSDPNMANYHLAAKPYPSTTQQHDYYSNFPTSDASQHGLPSYSYAGAPVPRQWKGQLPGGLLTTQGLDRPVRSHPVSVASSMASSTGSPATPSTVGEPGEAERKRNTTSGELKADLDLLLSYFSGASHSPFDEAAPLAPAIPKLERTMTDPYSDELYDAGFINTSAATTQPPSQPVTLPSTTNDVFHQRLQAANSAHLSAVNSPISAGTPHDRSPFHHDSPLAPLPMSGYPPSTLDQPAVRFPSAQQVREHNKAIADAEAMQHAMQQIVRGADTSEPQTISPKDALLAFNETPGEPANFPLFPSSQPQPQQQPQQRTFTGGYGADLGKAAASQGGQMFHGLPMGNRSFPNFLGQSTMPARTQQAQQQPQQQSQQQQQQQFSFVGRPQTSVPLMGSRPTESTVQRPIDVSADGGTYTCTYHGCTLRFDTPADLQKHKREGHRQAHGLGGARRADLAAAGATGPIIGSQAGPHKCYRINPSTGKPCNTIFSRPYDLTRHEDTIHNARKKKVRCDLCTDEKTFSRADALTRHYRVCHPDHEVPGKHRKRGAAQHHHSST